MESRTPACAFISSVPARASFAAGQKIHTPVKRLLYLSSFMVVGFQLR
jgi:hypothetical protein